MDNEMCKALLASVEEMDAITQGEKQPARVFEFPEPEVRAIREHTGLSQTRFAHLIGVSKRTLENWEQGRRHPTGPAKALLKIVQANPEAALRALHS